MFPVTPSRRVVVGYQPKPRVAELQTSGRKTEVLEVADPLPLPEPPPAPVVPVVKVAPTPKPAVAHPHAELGVNTKAHSQPWEIDHVLLAYVGQGLTPAEIAALSGVNVKKVVAHLIYWNVGGGEGWTPKREKSGLHARLTCDDAGRWYLKPLNA